MKVLIIEDEAAAASRLSKLLHDAAASVEIIEVLDSIETSVHFFQTQSAPDLVMMDIQLADGVCFNIFKQVEVKAPVIFTTAYDQFALEAFKVNSVDYLLKPVKEEDLKRALDKYHHWHEKATLLPDYEQLAQLIKQAGKSYKKRFLLRVGATIKTVNTEQVAYLYSEAKNTFLSTREGRTYTVDESLDKLEGLLDPGRFFRINRKFIVHIEAIEAMHTYSKARVLLELQPAYADKVVVSTERAAAFKRWLGDEEV